MIKYFFQDNLFILRPFSIVKSYGRPSDWWSIGMLIFFLYTGSDVYDGKTQEAVFNKILVNDIDFSSTGKEGRVLKFHSKSVSNLEDVTELLRSLVVFLPDERLHWNPKNKSADQPLRKLQFFVKGEKLIESGMKFQILKTANKGKKNNKRVMLPWRGEKISPSEQNYFKDFGCVI